jgi:hypothetical protein
VGNDPDSDLSVEYNTNPDTGEPEGLHIKRTINDSVGINDNVSIRIRRGEPEPPAEQPND